MGHEYNRKNVSLCPRIIHPTWCDDGWWFILVIYYMCVSPLVANLLLIWKPSYKGFERRKPCTMFLYSLPLKQLCLIQYSYCTIQHHIFHFKNQSSKAWNTQCQRITKHEKCEQVNLMCPNQMRTFFSLFPMWMTMTQFDICFMRKRKICK
jgi:hypothetical protein